MEIGPTMAKIPGGEGIFFKNYSKSILSNETIFLGKIRKKILTQIWVFGSFFCPLPHPGGQKIF